MEKNNKVYVFACHKKTNNAEYGIFFKNTKIMDCRYPTYRQELQRICGGIHYSEDFKQRNVYNDIITFKEHNDEDIVVKKTT